MEKRVTCSMSKKGLASPISLEEKSIARRLDSAIAPVNRKAPCVQWQQGSAAKWVDPQPPLACKLSLHSKKLILEPSLSLPTIRGGLSTSFASQILWVIERQYSSILSSFPALFVLFPPIFAAVPKILWCPWEKLKGNDGGPASVPMRLIWVL